MARLLLQQKLLFPSPGLEGLRQYRPVQQNVDEWLLVKFISYVRKLFHEAILRPLESQGERTSIRWKMEPRGLQPTGLSQGAGVVLWLFR